MEKIDKSLMLKSKNDQAAKPPAVKPLRIRWLPNDDDKPRINISYNKLPICFSISGIASVDR